MSISPWKWRGNKKLKKIDFFYEISLSINNKSVPLSWVSLVRPAPVESPRMGT